jgi:23S rRNA pseudouridine1911/1915/1917 synthase
MARSPFVRRRAVPGAVAAARLPGRGPRSPASRTEAPADAGPPVTRRLVADRGDAGQRVDRVLLRRLADVPGVSRTRVQRWIAEGRVRLGGLPPAKPSARVTHGLELTVQLPDSPARTPPQAEPIGLVILYEDAWLLAVDKPPGLVSHPAFKHASGTLLNALLWRGRTDSPAWTPRLVHRLDRHTSGVVLAAKTAEAHRALLEAWRTPDVRKTYLAIVWGRPPRRRGEIRLRLDRDPVDTRRVLASEGRGRESLTRYRLLATSRGTRAGLSLVACDLVTGRMHQIRAHLAAIGLPVVGDRLYGPARLPPTVDARLAALVRGLRRQALHAWRLRAPHPGDARVLEVTASVPDDMRALLTAAGIDADAALSR